MASSAAHIKRAHWAVKGALKRGKLQRGPCEICGVTHGQDGVIIDGHHDDYAAPLAVTWLCRVHHMEMHAILRTGLWVKP